MRYHQLLKILKKAGFVKTETEDHLLFLDAKSHSIMLPLVDGRRKVLELHTLSIRSQLKYMGNKNYKEIKLPE